MADPTQVPVTDKMRHTSVVFLGVTIPFLLLALSTLFARLNPRVRPAWRFSWDDGFIILGALFTLAEWGITIAAMYWAFSQPQFTSMAMIIQTTKFGYLAIPVWACAISTIKLSVICMLLRFPQGVAWKAFLYFMMSLQIAFALGNLIWLLGFQCRPIEKAWDGSKPGGACVSFDAMRTASNVSTYTNIATDLILSLMPLTFLTKLKRPVQERILVCGLMAMGLLASAASIKKTVIIQKFGLTPDIVGLEYEIELWSCLELFLGTMAACLPCLKSGFQQYMTRFGIVLNNHMPTPYFRSIFITTRPSEPEAQNSHKAPEMQIKEVSSSTNSSQNMV